MRPLRCGDINTAGHGVPGKSVIAWFRKLCSAIPGLSGGYLASEIRKNVHIDLGFLMTNLSVQQNIQFSVGDREIEFAIAVKIGYREAGCRGPGHVVERQLERSIAVAKENQNSC